MSNKTRAARRREERAKKKSQRLSRNVIIRTHVFGGEYHQSRQSLEHQKPK